MLYGLYAFMLICFGGMLWANKKSKMGVVWGKPLAALMGIMAVITAVVTMIMPKGGTSGPEIAQREAKFQYIAHKFLGQKIAERHPNAKILLIRTKPAPLAVGSSGDQIQKARMDGLKAGLGSIGIQAEEFVSSGMEEFSGGPNGPSPEELQEQMLTAEKMDALMEANPECNVVVSMVGLPPDFQKMKYWKKKPDERPALVLTNAYIYELKAAIKYGLISIVLFNKPVKFDIMEQKVPEDEQKAFDLRFALITPDNVDEIHKEFPRIMKEIDPKLQKK